MATDLFFSLAGNMVTKAYRGWPRVPLEAAREMDQAHGRLVASHYGEIVPEAHADRLLILQIANRYGLV